MDMFVCESVSVWMCLTAQWECVIILSVCLSQLVELKNGETYNGHLVSCDNWMNINLREVICTSRVCLLLEFKKSTYKFLSLFDLIKSWEIYSAKSDSSLVFQLFYAYHSLADTKTFYLTLMFASECFLYVPHTQQLNGMLIVLKWYHILDTQQC
jgi:small nuclear ribonucleoprotein (snRNP)-like protein